MKKIPILDIYFRVRYCCNLFFSFKYSGNLWWFTHTQKTLIYIGDTLKYLKIPKNRCLTIYFLVLACCWPVLQHRIHIFQDIIFLLYKIWMFACYYTFLLRAIRYGSLLYKLYNCIGICNLIFNDSILYLK